MTISTGNLIRSRNPGNAQSIIQSFLNDYLVSTNPNSPNNSVIFYTGSYPTRTMPGSTAKNTADARYAATGLFNSLSNQVSSLLTESNIANVGGQVITANQGVGLVYPASAAQGIPSASYTGFSQIFWGELQRYLIYRRVSATTTVTGNIPPVGVYTDSGKALINPSFPGDGTYSSVTVSGWNSGTISTASIINPAGSANLVPSRVISASTDGTIGSAAVTAFNTYWAQLMSNWLTAYTAAGTISLSTVVCHGSCHSSCHGSRGRR